MSEEGSQSSSPGVNMDVPSVWELGKSLVDRDTEMQPEIDRMNEAFGVQDGRASGDFAFGRGWGRYLGMTAMEGNMETMEKAMAAVESFRETNKILGNIAIKLANEYQTADALNNASLQEIQDSTGLKPPKPTGIHDANGDGYPPAGGDEIRPV